MASAREQAIVTCEAEVMEVESEITGKDVCESEGAGRELFRLMCFDFPSFGLFYLFYRHIYIYFYLFFLKLCGSQADF